METYVLDATMKFMTQVDLDWLNTLKTLRS